MIQTEIPKGLCHCGCGEQTRIAKRDWPEWGHVNGEPYRYLPGHQRRKWVSLWDRVDRSGGLGACWPWTGPIGPNGYAVIYDRKAKRLDLAHRAAYREANGAIPDGYVIDHLCRTPMCCNPRHLEAVPNAVNVRRGRTAKLTAEVVRAIRGAVGTHQQVAERFGISRIHVRNIRARRRWADL